MTRKVFLPGMEEKVARHRLRASVIQFWRLWAAWLSEMEGIRLLNTWQRDFWQPPAEALAGLPPDKRWQAVGAAVNINATTSALNFLQQLQIWSEGMPNVRLADSRFGALASDRLGDTLTAVFLILEEKGTVRMRPNVWPRASMRVRAGAVSRTDGQKPAVALVV